MARYWAPFVKIYGYTTFEDLDLRITPQNHKERRQNCTSPDSSHRLAL